MPTTRKSSRLSSGAAGGTKQSTLSFNHRVTKPAVSKSAKDNLVKPPSTKEITTKKDDESPAATDELDKKSRPPSPVTPQLEEAEKSEAEIRASRFSDAAIERYWGTIERGRMAKGVHKKHGEGQTVGEKVLRYFDVSSHYGPCIGVTRLKRWQRADKLGLNPPIEVLAALLKEEEASGQKVERAHMDELMNSNAV